MDKKEELRKRQELVLEIQGGRDPMITCQTEYYISCGTELAIDIYIPNPQKYSGKRPGILFFFGGGFYFGTRHAYRECADACAKAGYVAMTADYRIGAVHDTRAKDSILDGVEAWKFVRTHADRWSLDPDRIVLSGGSAGGIIAAMCGPLTGVEPIGLALFNPGLLDENMGPKKLSDLFGTEVNGVTMINANSPYEGMPPVLIMHGEADETIPVEAVKVYARNAEKLGIDIKLVIYPGQIHGFMQYNVSRAYHYFTLGEVLLFLDKVNQIQEDREEMMI